MTRLALLLLLLTASLLVTSRADAEPTEGSTSCQSITHANVVTCTLRANPAIAAEREAIAGAAGRRTATNPWFPTQPVLALSAARRVGGAEGRGDATNFYATLSQEIAVSGERSSRRRAADEDVAARTHDSIATSRRIAADAYATYYEALAARDAITVARLLESTALSIARVTKARADSGVGSPLDADVADAASLRIVQSRIASERALGGASARLATLIGADPIRQTPAIAGDLEPLAGSDALADSATIQRASGRPEVKSLISDERAAVLRAEAFRRARIPTLTLQVFAQNDGFNERVLGGGVAFPLPLPEPLGRRFAGEIAESEARGRESAARAQATTRELSNDLAQAVVDYRSRRAELALYSRGRVARAEQLLSEIGREIESGRLPVRDALVAQQQLIEVLRGYVDARRALCLSSVDLALAAGVALEGGGR